MSAEREPESQLKRKNQSARAYRYLKILPVISIGLLVLLLIVFFTADCTFVPPPPQSAHTNIQYPIVYYRCVDVMMQVLFTGQPYMITVPERISFMAFAVGIAGFALVNLVMLARYFMHRRLPGWRSLLFAFVCSLLIFAPFIDLLLPVLDALRLRGWEQVQWLFYVYFGAGYWLSVLICLTLLVTSLTGFVMAWHSGE